MIGKRHMKRQTRVLVAGTLLILGCLFTGMSFYGVSIALNQTGSQPNWLLLVLWGRPFGRGDLVAFRFPGSRYYGDGILFAKQVRGMPGDNLEIRDDRTFWLNGALLDTVRAADSKGEPVTPFYYRGKIPDGSYFLYAAAPKSYDSRYFGLIGKERIVGKVIPLF